MAKTKKGFVITDDNYLEAPCDCCGARAGDVDDMLHRVGDEWLCTPCREEASYDAEEASYDA